MDSYPLIIKWYAKRCLMHEAFLHSSTPGSLFTNHFHHERVAEMFRRIVIYFQDHLPKLKNPTEIFNPASLAFGMSIVSHENCLGSSGISNPTFI